LKRRWLQTRGRWYGGELDEILRYVLLERRKCQAWNKKLEITNLEEKENGNVRHGIGKIGREGKR